MRTYNLKKLSIPKAAVLATGLATALTVAIVNPAAPAQATPRAASCTGCHAGATSATTTATPSTATPAPGAAYTVVITLTANPAGGNSGYGIVPVTAGTGSTFGGNTGALLSYTATMTAPAAAGTYSYTVWTNQGSTRAGEVGSVVYSVTVGAAPTTAPPTTTPTTVPPTVPPTAPPTVPPVSYPIQVDGDALSPTSALGASHLSMYNGYGATCNNCHDGTTKPAPPSISGEDIDMESGTSCRTCHAAGGREDELFISQMNDPAKIVYNRCSDCHAVVNGTGGDSGGDDGDNSGSGDQDGNDSDSDSGDHENRNGSWGDWGDRAGWGDWDGSWGHLDD